MESSLRYLWVLFACLFLQVQADCKSYGVDFSNGGTYQIDGTSNDYFTFITVFQGCNQETINPILVSPDNNEYACSSINTQPEGTQVTSTCGIPFSAMKSGAWKIIVEGSQIAVQRTINLNIGSPSVVIVTATPTIVLGITSTPRAQTVRTTSTQTQTLIVVGTTVTQNCGGNGNGGTRTVTNFPQNSQTVTRTSTILRTITDGQRTSYYTTTVSATASCHDASTQTNYDGNAVIASAVPVVRGRGGNRAREVANAAEKRAIAGSAAVAAITSTYTETTYTVTKTVVTTIPARTTTELALTTTTTTVTPLPSTFCAGGNDGGQVTVTVIAGGGPVTQTNIVYETTRASGTVYVGQTQYTTLTNSASATACWRNGGWFGV